jgi:[ribosomal protein S5]-alanine N-acetyltransferase
MPSPPPVQPPPQPLEPPPLTAGSLALRPFRVADAEEIWPWVSQPPFTRFMSWAAHRDLDETREYLRDLEAHARAGRALVWAVTRGGAIVGNVGLLDLTFAVRAQRVDRGELGFWTAPHAQGQGVARAAAAAVLAWAFDELHLHRVTVRCVELNLPSRRVIERLGFRWLARIEEDCYRDGSWFDVLVYELRAAQWRDDRAAPRP